MGTKIAPCFASLFIGKHEMDFLGSCDKTPLIWLHFTDIANKICISSFL